MHQVVAAQDACLKMEAVADLEAAERELDATRQRLDGLRQALETAQLADGQAKDQAHFCHDHIALPIRIFMETMELYVRLQEARLAWTRYAAARERKELDAANAAMAQAAEVLRGHLETRRTGDKNPKWATWYAPEKRRPNGGFPDLAAIEGFRLPEA
jgi:multidrug resistance efflux pump